MKLLTSLRRRETTEAIHVLLYKNEVATEKNSLSSAFYNGSVEPVMLFIARLNFHAEQNSAN